MNKMYIIVTLVWLVQAAPLSAADAGHKKIAKPVLRVKRAAGMLIAGNNESCSAVEHAALLQYFRNQANNAQKNGPRLLGSNTILGQPS